MKCLTPDLKQQNSQQNAPLIQLAVESAPIECISIQSINHPSNHSAQSINQSTIQSKLLNSPLPTLGDLRRAQGAFLLGIHERSRHILQQQNLLLDR